MWYLERRDEASTLDNHLTQLEDLVAELCDRQATASVVEESCGNKRCGSCHGDLIAFVEHAAMTHR